MRKTCFVLSDYHSLNQKEFPRLSFVFSPLGSLHQDGTDLGDSLYLFFSHALGLQMWLRPESKGAVLFRGRASP